EIAMQGLRHQAADALASAAAHWARVRDRAALSSQERQAGYRTLQVLRTEWDVARRGTDGPTHQPGGPMAEAALLQALIRRVRAFDLGLTSAPAGEIRGVWIHTYAPTDWDRVARQVKAAGLNCLFVRVGRGGNV